MISIQDKIDMACAYAHISKAELSRRLGYATPQAFQKRYKTGKFTQDELQKSHLSQAVNIYLFLGIQMAQSFKGLYNSPFKQVLI